jgi:hypothetical protein
MGLLITVIADVAVASLIVFVIFSQARPVWRDSAEHSRGFWLAWVAISVAVGVAPVTTGVMSDVGAAVWLTACCAFAALQPALWADVLEVRRDVARRRRVLLDKRRQEEARVEADRIRWHED